MGEVQPVKKIKPVVALDIDGTIAAYHQHFTWFAEQWTGRPMPDPDTNTQGSSFYRWLGMSRRTYNECKLAFRQGGLKRSMPCYPGTAEAIREIRKHAEVWICTTRPYLRLDNIDPDTRHWLRRNKVQHDAVIFGHNKYNQLRHIVGQDRIVLVVDDLPEQYDKAVSLGLPAVLRDQPYNRYREDAHRVLNSDEIMHVALESIDKWRSQQ